MPAPIDSTTPASEHRFDNGKGDYVRVIVVGDVIALPDYHWSKGYFGRSISVEWLLHDGELPGALPQRKMLAGFIVKGLEAHHSRRAVRA